MSRELSDILIVLIAITIPTIAILTGIMLPKWLAHRERQRVRERRLKADNAGLRNQIGEVKDRLADVERIVTDDSRRLTQEIDSLLMPKN